MFEFAHSDDSNNQAVIKVIGVGGGGGNAIAHMVTQTIEGVQFIAANTDAQALGRSKADLTIQLGSSITKGLGAGTDPSVGRDAAEEDQEMIRAALEGADMVFIATGMGGGTGTGAAPVVARIARELGILTVAVVTRPFEFEGKKRATVAQQGIDELSQYVDSLITIPNEKLLRVLGKGTPLLEAFKAANNVLYNAVQGIAELITRPGLINVDFADVKAVMSAMGVTMMGSASATGADRAQEAIELAIASPLLEDVNFKGAKGILVSITAGMDFSLDEYQTVGNHISPLAADNAVIKIGTTIDPEMQDSIRVTVVATGLGNEAKPSMKLVEPRAEQMVSGLDIPSFAASAKQPAVAVNPEPVVATKPEPAPAKSADYFDIPAFLRKQAD